MLRLLFILTIALMSHATPTTTPIATPTSPISPALPASPTSTISPTGLKPLKITKNIIFQVEKLRECI